MRKKVLSSLQISKKKTNIPKKKSAKDNHKKENIND